MTLEVGLILSLRQICLVATDLARETELVKAIFGLEECYRDPNVARYGLENVLFPVGTDFIEIVSPTRPATAAGRFLERHGGRHGYMVIMNCDDPEQQQRHCEQLGIRTANVVRHDGYLGVQLHPKDTGGTMLEFNQTVGGEDPMGAYAPAGGHWQQAIRRDVTQGLISAEIDCPDVTGFASRWSEILQKPVQSHPEGRLSIELDHGTINFLPAGVLEPVFAGIELRIVERSRVLAAAQARGCAVTNSTVEVCGVRFRLTETK